jgi:hypothetical protein
VEPKEGARIELPTFSSPEEELKYLRTRVAEIDHQSWEDSVPTDTQAAVSQVVHEYAKVAASQEKHITDNQEFESAVGCCGHREGSDRVSVRFNHSRLKSGERYAPGCGERTSS